MAKALCLRLLTKSTWDDLFQTKSSARGFKIRKYRISAREMTLKPINRPITPPTLAEMRKY